MSSAQGEIAGRRSADSATAWGRAIVSNRALLSLLAAIALALSVISVDGINVAEAAIERAKSFIELMHQRSPGHRTVGHLAKTKHKKFALHERALPKTRKRAPQLAAIPAFPAELPPAPVDLVSSPLPVEMASLEAVPVGPFETPGGGPGFFLPPTGGFILPPTESPVPSVVLPPIVTPQAVPEPGSWLLMLVGFGLIGVSLRKSLQRSRIRA